MVPIVNGRILEILYCHGRTVLPNDTYDRANKHGKVGFRKRGPGYFSLILQKENIHGIWNTKVCKTVIFTDRKSVV